ncbi:MAG: adenylate/guanylate cyclase domain-containing protein [Candidatus Eremiobacteraeota bacterium]|nr:adenylate/guanylate cyclase domain-containing protein [Candidatus Eremiobacteraeota bacterium]MBV9699419.1 adenylate/guanylate cyclase domain-containing protein [Candidatus Eremiobacteraeota bacterium]
MAGTRTVTFLFTDIEGSTQRWERDSAAMARVLRCHDAVVREAIIAQGGDVFKTVGDAFCAVFPAASTAVAAAVAAQHALASEDFSAVEGAAVRMALHSGTAAERDGDFFGPAVNRVARLLGIAHGGQILLSSTTAELLRGEMPAEYGLRDLGSHKLKDLARAEQVYQLLAAGLREDFPPLRSLDVLPNNLPLQLNSFVGRDDDVREITTMLSDHRLVTLVGAGGAGKSRCAIQVGAALLGSYADGVWLIELAPIADGSMVAGSIAQALNVRESTKMALTDTLVAHLKSRRLLLVLDNCEHVIDSARTVVAAILRACSAVRVLATSREALNLGGERVFRLPSLAVPPPREAVPAQAARSYGAVALFVDRASATDGCFKLDDGNAPFVIEISRRLDGIPLAIELAAARIKVLSPRQLAQKLDERFRVLTGGDRSALPRHQTMRALIDWSYDLLSDQERSLFRKLAIFAGGFTLESAAAVCGGDTLDELGVMELLASLVDKSLVQAGTSGDVPRYGMLESTRQYARERLSEHGELPAAARAHAETFLDLARRLERSYDTTQDEDWFAQVEAESENWRAALDWTLTTAHDLLLGQRLAGELARQWAFLAPAEGLRWIQRARTTIDGTTPGDVAARLDLAQAQLDGVLGMHKAGYAAAERALEQYRALGDADGVAQAQRHAGRGLVLIGKVVEGEALLREALSAFRASGARILAGATLENIGLARNVQGDLSGTRALYAEALAIYRAEGAQRLMASVANNLAEAEFHEGNAETAIQLAQEALASDRGAIFSRRTPYLMSNLAAYLIAVQRYDDARRRACEALKIARNVQYEVAVVWALQHLAAIAALQPQADQLRLRENRRRAAGLLAYTDARLNALAALREHTEQQEYDKVQAVLREAFDEKELASLANEGRLWNEDTAVEIALL